VQNHQQQEPKLQRRTFCGTLEPMANGRSCRLATFGAYRGTPRHFRLCTLGKCAQLAHRTTPVGLLLAISRLPQVVVKVGGTPGHFAVASCRTVRSTGKKSGVSVNQPQPQPPELYSDLLR
jgi:hypothetical protein